MRQACASSLLHPHPDSPRRPHISVGRAAGRRLARRPRRASTQVCISLLLLVTVERRLARCSRPWELRVVVSAQRVCIMAYVSACTAPAAHTYHWVEIYVRLCFNRKLWTARLKPCLAGYLAFNGYAPSTDRECYTAATSCTTDVDMAWNGGARERRADIVGRES